MLNEDLAQPRRLRVPRVLVRASELLGRWPAAVVWAVVISAALVIGALDVLTGPQVSLSIFYVVPVITAAWHIDWRAALVMVAITALVWLTADVISGATYDSETVRFWNAGARAALFFTVAFTITLLKEALAHERELARTDGLTGLNNVRSFEELAAHELASLRRRGLPVSLAYIDVDDFKDVNDTRGHAAGDALLKEVAAAIVSAVREADIVARLGGDEFAVLVPEADELAARATVTRILDQLNAAAIAGDWPVAFSAGVASFAAAPHSLQPLVRAADDAMYAVKRAGGHGTRFVSGGGSVKKESGASNRRPGN